MIHFVTDISMNLTMDIFGSVIQIKYLAIGCLAMMYISYEHEYEYGYVDIHINTGGFLK